MRGLWRRGSVLEGRVQVRGGVRWPHALPLGSGARGRRLLSAASSSFGPAALPGVRPGILARQPSRGWRSSTLNAPFLDPRGHQRACTGKRPVSRGEAHSAYNSGGDEAPFTSGVCLITRRQTWLFQRPPLSHTHSRREPGEGRRIRDREMLIIRGEATDSSQYIYIYIILQFAYWHLWT